MTPTLTRLDALHELKRRRDARKNLLDFTHYVWWERKPFLDGRHVRQICERLDRAVDDYFEGLSTFLIIEVVHRHGKSTLASTAFPPYFLGRCAGHEPDVILTGYGQHLVNKFSRRCQNIIQSPRYKALFPDVALRHGNKSVESWGIAGSKGEVTIAGLGGSIIGSGGDLIVVDDYCRTREEAESETYRDKTSEAIRDNVLTRRAPVSIVILVATRWHVDDAIGRIRQEMAADADFPQFEIITFPAQRDEWIEPDNPRGHLFPERYPPEWYQTERKLLGRYSAAALMDLDPVIRRGRIFAIDQVQIHDDPMDFPQCQYVRAWDLASTEKERIKDDPDYTAGALVGVTHNGPVPEVWIADVQAFQADATRRDARILETMDWDGNAVHVGVESVAGYKDAFTTLRDLLKGRRTVKPIPLQGDKVVRAGPLEPIFEAGNVHILRAPWNDLFFRHFREFPGGTHDDIVDAVTGAYHMLKRTPRIISRKELGF